MLQAFMSAFTFLYTEKDLKTIKNCYHGYFFKLLKPSTVPVSAADIDANRPVLGTFMAGFLSSTPVSFNTGKPWLTI